MPSLHHSFTFFWFNLCIYSKSLVFAYDGNYYFLNQKQFTWNEARTYCQYHCNSELASIHDETQNLKAIDAITNSDEWQINDNQNIWFGLYGTTTQWSDATTYDYGTETTQYPWETQGSSSGDCTKFSNQQDYVWQHDGCNAEYISLCNSCDSKFNKYVVVKVDGQWSDHDNSCVSYFGTDWASFHSQEDFDEAVLIAQITSQDLWTGLNDRSGYWAFSDGTPVDFADNVSPTGQYPWRSGEPSNSASWGVNEDCAEILQQYGELNDAYCTHTFAPSNQWALCNAISELCYQNGKYWTDMVIDTETVTWSGNSNCELYMDATVGNVLMVMIGKQWVNNEEALRVHYMMRVESATDGDTGIVMNYVNDRNYYYGGIGISNNEYRLFIGRMENGNYNELSEIILTITGNVYYQMEFSVGYDNVFVVSVNGYSVSYTDTTKAADIFSGFIGIRNSGSRTRAKSLFVSGSKVYMKSTITPTFDPTVGPTFLPTLLPSVSPLEMDIITTENVVVTPSPTNAAKGIDQASDIDVGDSSMLILAIAGFTALCCVLICLCGVYYNLSKGNKEANNAEEMVNAHGRESEDVPGNMQPNIMEQEVKVDGVNGVNAMYMQQQGVQLPELPRLPELPHLPAEHSDTEPSQVEGGNTVTIGAETDAVDPNAMTFPIGEQEAIVDN